jgi:hypothetical protein
LLERYFDAIESYRSHLAEAAATGARPNREILAAFRGSSLVQAGGLAAAEPAARDRSAICTLYDETKTVAERLRIVERLLDRSDLLAFLPSLEAFVGRHPVDQMTGDEAALFGRITRHGSARDEVMKLVHGLDVSALRMELAHLAVHMRWMTRDEFRTLALDGANQLLRLPLSTDVVDIMCEVTKHETIGGQIGAADLPATLFQSGEGIRFIDCLSPAGDAVSARLAASVESENVWVRIWAVYALSRRMPLPDDALVTLAAHLADPELIERLRWMFLAQEGVSEQVRRAVEARDPQLARRLHREPHAKTGLRPVTR